MLTQRSMWIHSCSILKIPYHKSIKYVGLDKLDEIFQKRTARGANGVPGVVLAVINKQGCILSRSSGYASHVADAEHITPSHIFRQMSTTKLLTVVCTLQLVQAGKMSLDDASLIDAHLPEVMKQEIRITLRHLLTHTSGVGYDAITPALIAWRKCQGIDQSAFMTKFTSGTMAEGIAAPLLFEPGEGWTYGAGIDAIGVFIERVTGRDLESYMKEHIYDVLGMKSTSFYVQDKPEMEEKLIGVAMRKDDGMLEAIPAPNNDAPTDANGGMGLCASTEDFLKVLHDLLQDEPKVKDEPQVVSCQYRDMLFAPPQLAEGSSTLEALRSQLPLLVPTMDILDIHVSINHSLAGLLWTGSEYLPQAEGIVMWFGALGTMWFVQREAGVAGYYASQMAPPGDLKNVDVMKAFWKVALKAIPAGLHET